MERIFGLVCAPGRGPLSPMRGWVPWVGLGLLLGCAAPPPRPGAPTAQVAPELRNPARAAFRHHAIRASLDPETARFQATDTITLVHAPGVAGTTSVPFLLNRDLVIERIASDGAQLAWAERERWEPRDFWARPQYPELAELTHGRQIDLHLQRAAVWPETLRVTFEYSGTIYDSLKPPPENYQRGFETTTGLIDPRGAYLSSGTLWYPERFDEPFTFTLTASVPPTWTAISQGFRARSGAWISNEPMDEIYLIAGPYEVRSEAHRGVQVETYTYGNDDDELCRTYLDATREYLDLYGDLIGPYPFAKFALVENFWQTGYGMPSFTLLGDVVVRLPWIVHTSYGHEILHNWWGNGVFVDWESGNWCEGLTVYGADYLYKEQQSEADARDYRRTTLQGYLDYARAGQDFPLTEFRARHDASSAAVGYGKSMMIYHMLRRQFGDGLFWKALAEFYERHLFKRASWDDLLAAFGDNAPFDCEAFHAQWIARSGAPMITLRDVAGAPVLGEQVAVTYTIEQREPLYRLAIPVRATFSGAPPQTWTVNLTGPTFTETRTLPHAPQTLAVDPDFDVFRRLHREEVPAALSQLFGADTLTIVLGAEGSLSPLAEEAARAKPTGIFSDDDSAPGDWRAGGVWCFGEPAWMDELRDQLPPGVTLGSDEFSIGGETFVRSQNTLVMALPHPHDADEALGLLIGGNAASAAGIWRKLPHYGKYSYLVFEGTRNVAKGSWAVAESPLKVHLMEGS